MTGTIYAGRVGYSVTFLLAMPAGVDGTTATSARLAVTTPSGASIEWVVAVIAPTTSQVPARHATDGTSNAAAGEHKAAITLYDAVGDVLYTSPIFRFVVSPNPVATPV